MSSTSLSSTGAVSVVRVATTITLGLNRTVYYEGHEPKHNLKKKLSFKIWRLYKIFHGTNVHFMSPARLNWDLSHQLACFCRRVTFTYDKVVVVVKTGASQFQLHFLPLLCSGNQLL